MPQLDRQRLQTLITLMVLILMVAVFSALSERFLTIDNLRNVTRNASSTVIVGCAVTLVMIARGLDLSVGSVLAVSGVFAATLAVGGWPIWAAVVAATMMGAGLGLLNGALIVGTGISPIIATLGTLNIARGAAYLITPSAIIVGLPEEWGAIGTSSLGPIPVPVVIATGVFFLFKFLLDGTIFGRHVYAIGGSEETARLSGIGIGRVLLVLYVLAGATAGLVGVLLSSRVGSGDPNVGIGFEFDVIVAVILGGTSLAGGEGRLSGTVIGALIVAFLANGLNLIGVESFWQYVAKGIVLILAVIIDHWARSGRLSLPSRRIRRQVGTR